MVLAKPYSNGMEARSSSLAIFDKPNVQTDFQKTVTVDYHPVSSVEGGGPIEFHIPGNAEDYIDLNDISLYVKFHVTRSNGKPIVDADKVGLVNLPISTLFQDVYLTVGDQQIEGGQNIYPYLGYFNTVTQFEPQAQFSHMQAQGWHKDDAGKFEDDGNSGFKKRAAMIAGSSPAEVIGPLFLDFFRQDRYLISQTSMRIKLLPSKPEFALMALAATKDFKIQMTEVILYVPRTEMNPSVINGHALGLRKQNALYPLTHNEVYTYTIPKGQKSYTKDQLFMDQSPKLLLVAMIENDALNGSLAKNPFNFQHFNLSKIALYREGRSVPGPPFTPDFGNEHYLRSYKYTMRSLNYYNTDDTNGLTPKMFGAGYTIYAFDLTADGDISAAHNQAIPSNNLRLDLFFDKALPTTINVLLFASFNSAVEITHLRDVITHYTR